MIGLNIQKTSKNNSIVNNNKENKVIYNNSKQTTLSTNFNGKSEFNYINRGRNSRQFGSDITNIVNNNESLKLKHVNLKNSTKSSLILTNPLSNSTSLSNNPNFNLYNNINVNKSVKEVNSKNLIGLNSNFSNNCNISNYNYSNSSTNVIPFTVTNYNISSTSLDKNMIIDENNDLKNMKESSKNNTLNSKTNPQIASEYLESIINTLFEAENQKQEVEFRRNINEFVLLRRDLDNDIPLSNNKSTNIIFETSKYYATPEYMKIFQTEINDKMRAILFNWLVDVHFKWKLLPETLYLTFNLIDRFLSLKNTLKEELQCVGVSALLIACKYEEIYFPELHDFREITDNTFSKSDILKKEYEILNLLEFNLTFPSILRFFEAFNVILNLNNHQKFSCYFLMELCVFDYNLIKNKPSLVAAGCILFVCWNNIEDKSKILSLCRHTEEDLISIFKEILNIYQKTENGSKSIKRKYSSSKFSNVGNVNLINQYITLGNNNSNCHSGESDNNELTMKN